MSEHKFRIGQVVGFKSAEGCPAPRLATYKILRLIARNGAECAYGVKTILEPAERIANQNELVELSLLSSPRLALLPIAAERNTHDHL